MQISLHYKLFYFVTNFNKYFSNLTKSSSFNIFEKSFFRIELIKSSFRGVSSLFDSSTMTFDFTFSTLSVDFNQTTFPLVSISLTMKSEYRCFIIQAKPLLFLLRNSVIPTSLSDNESNYKKSHTINYNRTLIIIFHLRI